MRHYTLFIITMLILFLSTSVYAQTEAITEDDVARVAEQMYCPVCENIPLDDCGTATCVQWKDEIRQQLAEGQSDQQIINDFVARYGQHVVGIPQDPLLRNISLVVPWLAVLVVGVLGIMTFLRWQQAPDSPPVIRVESLNGELNDDEYRARFEEDLS